VELAYPGKTKKTDLFQQTLGATAQLEARHWETEEGWHNRLYHGDNLPVLKSLYEDDEVRGKVQLVYIDPPFASKQAFRHRKDQDAHAYDDTLADHHYVEFLRQRLLFLHELLAPQGAIYIHLDSNMTFHIKLIMDEIFGEGQFRNFITRKKCHSKNYTRKQYGNVADYILFYAKSGKMKWNRPYEQENIYTFEQRFPKVDPETGRRYALVPIHAPGTRNGETGKPWRGMVPPQGKHWQVTPAELDRLDAAGEIYWSPTGNPRRKIFAENDKGVPVQDIWTKFMDFRNQMMKDTGYPTEKNAALMRRILEASSDPGDLVLDCFCGSGTTLAVARDLGRRWIGVDNSELAIKTTVERLQCPTPAATPVPDQLTLLDTHEHEEAVQKRYTAFAVYRAVSPVSTLVSGDVPTS
jgi:adenine-specific DNA-methyltransferase